MLAGLLLGAALGLLAALPFVIQPGLAFRAANLLELAAKGRTRERVLILVASLLFGAVVGAVVGP